MTDQYSRKVIGLIPAAGKATRLGPLPCSKEVYPVGSRQTADGKTLPKAVSHYLLEKMRAAGIHEAYVILRAGKWDIPDYFRDGGVVDMRLGYLITEILHGTPYTLDQAYPFVRDSLVALGFPDILFSPDDAFVRLLEHQAATRADAVLGLFPADQPQKTDVVDVAPDRRIRQIIPKPETTELRQTWGIAVWTPAVTEFLHQFLAGEIAHAAQAPELFVGHVLQAAIDRGMRVEGIKVSDEPFLDIGTAEDLARALTHFGGKTNRPESQRRG